MAQTRRQIDPRQIEEARRARLVMMQIGLRMGDLARLIGHPVKQVTNVFCGNSVSWPICSAVNQILGAEFFSRPAASLSQLPSPVATKPPTPKNRMVRRSDVHTRKLESAPA